MSLATKSLPADYKKAFKDADIRGLFGSEIDEVLAYKVAFTFVKLNKLKKVVVGRDMRVSSPKLAKAFWAGAIDAGADVTDLGLISTPMLYYVSGKEKKAGVMITASHNPKEYNGFKLVHREAVPLTGKTGLNDILRFVTDWDSQAKVAKKRGVVEKRNITKEFFAYIESKFPIPKKRTVHMVIDVGNGMGALLLPLLRKYAHVTALATKLDGTFPSRDSNPTLKKSQRAIVSALKTGKSDLGVSFDGDADRVAFFDERGQYLNAAHVGALLTSQMLVEYPKSSFVYTVFTSRAYLQTIKELGGKAVRARVGHAFIKETMRKHDALFGCEHSAHFYFKDNYYTDSVIMAVLEIIQSVAVGKALSQPLSKTIAPYTAYFQTEEVLVEVPDRDATIKAVAIWGKDQGALVLMFDGVSVEVGEWWCHVKKSVTEDAVKFVVESKDKKLALAKAKELHAFLQTCR